MRAFSLISSVVLGLSLFSASAPAWAGPTGAAAAARAGELFRQGRAASAAGDDKTACERFLESQKLQPAPGTQLNLGGCEAKQGHLLAAREHFREAAAGFKPDDRRRAVAVNAATDLTDRLPTLKVHVAPTAPPDTQVTLEGAPLDPKILEQGIELDPGKTSLVVNAKGHEPRTYDVDLAEAEKRELTVDPGATTPDAAAAAPVNGVKGMTSDADRAATRDLEHTLGFVGVGVGGAGIVVGSIFGILAFNEASTLKANCTANYACRPAGVSAASSGNTDGIVSTTAFIAGATFAAAGVYLVIATSGDDRASAPHTSRRSLTLSPLAIRAGGGAAGTWTF